LTTALRSIDLPAIQQAQRVLLNPLDHERLDDWRDHVNLAMKEALGADLAAFAFPVPGEHLFHSRDVDLSFFQGYSEFSKEVDQAGARQKKIARDGIWTRRSLFRSSLREYYRSEYYQNLVIPTHAFDAVGLAAPVEGSLIPATLFLHHQQRTGRKFGRRGFEILQLLQPAFDAGVHAYLDFGRRKSSLFVALDGVLVYDAAGRLKHQNSAVATMLDNDPERDAVRFVIQRIVTSLIDGILSSRKSRELFAAPASQEVSTARGRYIVRGCYLGADLLGERLPVMVTLSRESPALPTIEDLQGRFGLTAREASVALLVADRYSNDEIAATLGISPHTAHHHTERVLGKLGVTSRNRVRRRLVSARA
jgi:DNA-binding CsgD family transcriptional regulator